MPVRIGYYVLENYIQEKFTGENIKVENDNGEATNYAEILGVSVQRSWEEDYDLALHLEFRTLTSFFKNRKGSIVLHVAISFDDEEQEITVQDYKLQGTGKSWLMNKSLQALANKFLYEKLRKKMSFDLGPQISEQLKKTNQKLETRLEATGGIFLSGEINRFRITDIIPGESHILVLVSIVANAVLDIEKINL